MLMGMATNAATAAATKPRATRRGGDNAIQWAAPRLERVPTTGGTAPARGCWAPASSSAANRANSSSANSSDGGTGPSNCLSISRKGSSGIVFLQKATLEAVTAAGQQRFRGVHAAGEGTGDFGD